MDSSIVKIHVSIQKRIKIIGQEKAKEMGISSFSKLLKLLAVEFVEGNIILDYDSSKPSIFDLKESETKKE